MGAGEQRLRRRPGLELRGLSVVQGARCEKPHAGVGSGQVAAGSYLHRAGGSSVSRFSFFCFSWKLLRDRKAFVT